MAQAKGKAAAKAKASQSVVAVANVSASAAAGKDKEPERAARLRSWQTKFGDHERGIDTIETYVGSARPDCGDMPLDQCTGRQSELYS